MTGSLRQFHADDRGGISILLLLTAFVLLALIAMVWNVGDAAVRRTRAQAAADTAAYSAASWLSRGENIVTAGNIQIVRVGSAASISYAALLAEIEVADNLAEAGGSWVNWFNPEWYREWYRLVQLATRTAPTLRQAFGDLPDRAEAIHHFQQSVVRAIPRTIEQQRSRLQSYSRCDTRLTQPFGLSNGGDASTQDNNSSIRLPVVESSSPHWQMLLPLRRRVQIDRVGLDPTFATFFLGQGASAWQHATQIAPELYMLLTPRGNAHYDLPTAWGIFECHGFPSRISDAERIRHFTVLAAVHPNWLTNQPHSLLPDYFNSPHTIVAYAQAETFNGLERNPLVLAKYLGYEPWRLWSKEGWSWQPRLSSADALQTAMEHDDTFRAYLSSGGVQNYERDQVDLAPINLH